MRVTKLSLLFLASTWLLMACSEAPPEKPMEEAPAEPEVTTPEVAAPEMAESTETQWETVFFDDFDSFNPENWQDQILWVNDEDQCYVRDGQYGTREVSDGSLKLKVINIGEEIECDNMDKHGEQHPPTKYVAGRLASKNLKEFSGGRWTARIKLHTSGVKGMFPAWWLLGAYNNEPPVQEENENICWPLVGSGEVDIFEHHGEGGKGHFAVRTIASQGECDKGDWLTPQKVVDADLEVFNEYGAEWRGEDIVFLVNGEVVHTNAGAAKDFPEPFFAILNYAKIDPAPMEGEWVMEVDWVKYEAPVTE